jgi:hypothetical protein
VLILIGVSLPSELSIALRYLFGKSGTIGPDKHPRVRQLRSGLHECYFDRVASSRSPKRFSTPPTSAPFIERNSRLH